MNLGIKTNNEAEFISPLVGLQHLSSLTSSDIIVCGDSKILIKALVKNSSPKLATLDHHFIKIHKIPTLFHSTTYHHVLRELNGLANEHAKHKAHMTTYGLELGDTTFPSLDPPS